MFAVKPIPSLTVAPVVCSYNEWDPLEEVIVGVAEGAAVPEWHPTLAATLPARQRRYFQENGGRPFPPELLSQVHGELDGLSRLLEREGVVVRRPCAIDFARPYATPDWRSASGLYAAMPRDLLLVIGDEIIEAPMSWRSRHHEVNAYRELLKEYFARGARWAAAPRPELRDALYDLDYRPPGAGEDMRYVITEHEPVFDAADFVRCGRDLFYLRSHTTNEFGVEWLRRHLGPTYRIHRIECEDDKPMHIDTTFMPLAPGKLMINPERVTRVPEMFRGWEVLRPPPPATGDLDGLHFSGPWLSMNVLMLDERRVVVAEHESALIAALGRWGFEPLKCPFSAFYRLGGSIHCATLDVRRRGELRSYF